MANAWHHRSDALSSLPVALAILAANFQPTWTFVDSIAASIVAAMIIMAGFQIIRPAFHQLIDTGANEREKKEIIDLAYSIPAVKSVHAIRTRYLGNGLQLDFHIQVDPHLTVEEGHNVAGQVKRLILDRGPDVIDVLIHLEPYYE